MGVQCLSLVVNIGAPPPPSPWTGEGNKISTAVSLKPLRVPGSGVYLNHN